MAVNYNTRVVNDGLMLYLDAANRKSYPKSGTVWTDLSGNGYNGTLNGNVTHNNNAFEFDGVDDYCLIDPSFNSFGSQAANGFSISMWLKTTTTLSRDVFGTVDDGAGILTLFLRFNVNATTGETVVGDTIFFIRTPPDQINTVYMSENIYDGQWHNLVWCYDGLNTHTVYVDGSQVTAISNPANPFDGENTTGWNDFDYPLAIGALNYRATFLNHSDVDMGIFQAYNKVLSSTEIQQNFNALRGRYGL